jgi:hypothetical protein
LPWRLASDSIELAKVAAKFLAGADGSRKARPVVYVLYDVEDNDDGYPRFFSDRNNNRVNVF